MDATELYLRVREKEGRLYSDAIVARLPDLPGDHPLASEWRSRADSCSRLTCYLTALKRSLSILELGCGNGWLAHRLSLIPEANVWGLDRISPELEQAARVFNCLNLKFLSADIFNHPFALQTFDVVILASVIQYFPDLPKLIHTLQELLRRGGEIHLLDSHVYLPEEIPSAQERTRAYYTSLGFPEMADHYYHHSTSELEEFPPRWLYHPNSLHSRLKRLIGLSASPFPWLVIR